MPKHSEAQLLAWRRYREKHKAERNLQSREWRKRNKGQKAGYEKEYYKGHKEQAFQSAKEWKDRNPDYVKQYAILNNKRKKVQYRELQELFGGRCFICKGTNKLCFHHLSYKEKGNWNKASRDAKIEEVKERPWNFILLCGRCHRLVHQIKKNIDLIDRILQVVNMTDMSRYLGGKNYKLIEGRRQGGEFLGLDGRG